jgi:hypothetical protein
LDLDSRVRLLKGHKQFSDQYKNIDIAEIKALPGAVFEIAEKRIYAGVSRLPEEISRRVGQARQAGRV